VGRFQRVHVGIRSVHDMREQCAEAAEGMRGSMPE